MMLDGAVVRLRQTKNDSDREARERLREDVLELVAAIEVERALGERREDGDARPSCRG
jgi:hypothetical protein